MIKRYDRASTPHRRADRHQGVGTEDRNLLADSYAELNPAAIQRDIQTLTTRLLTVTTSKTAATTRPALRQAAS